MFCLDPADHRPLYEQIKEKLKGLMIDGYLQEDAPLPSVRELAVSLAINPNTIQKAYKDLEAEGFIYSLRGKGSFVASLNQNNNPRKEELLKITENCIRELSYLGAEETTLQELISKIYVDKQNIYS